MAKITILWADDEIDLLKPHILFLRDKGYEVITTNNGDEALDIIKQQAIDIVLLDENMPGISGIETLSKIKNIRADLPVVMITKSEEESIMEDAIGSKISDYLIKPVNPNQILLSIKKNLDNKRLISEKTTSAYQQDFRNIGITLSDKLNFDECKEVYKKLIFWELELEKSKDGGMAEVLQMQKTEANQQFFKFIESNYLSWLNVNKEKAPLMSHTLFKNKVAPHLDKELPVFMILIDNLRFDQWKVIQHVFNEYFRLDEEEMYYGILPTATQYSRNAIFAGLMPSEIEKRFPNLWFNDEDEGGKNLHESEFLAEQLKRLGKNVKFSYTKVTNIAAGKRMVESIPN
ncbi:MAG: bifunctional response regulator/alkaline phosphatase family protein, partial [Bacteroidota bacterium]